jgi:hypothetical protein
VGPLCSSRGPRASRESWSRACRSRSWKGGARRCRTTCDARVSFK